VARKKHEVLLYDISKHVWPTNVDLMDFMLLVQDKTGADQLLLKGLLLAAALAYLAGFTCLYRRGRRTREHLTR
jgi:hypothetical protein